jgi:hypothetical protein
MNWKKWRGRGSLGKTFPATAEDGAVRCEPKAAANQYFPITPTYWGHAATVDRPIIHSRLALLHERSEVLSCVLYRLNLEPSYKGRSGLTSFNTNPTPPV